jgi:hypothetical protein
MRLFLLFLFLSLAFEYALTHIAVIPKKNEGFRGFDYF